MTEPFNLKRRDADEVAAACTIKGYEAGWAAAEREIVAWLRGNECEEPLGRKILEIVADRIEKQEYRK